MCIRDRRKLSDIAPAVDTIETTEESTAASRLAFYLTFSSYNVTSVSYTHLDVYKRQRLGRPHGQDLR